MLLCDADLALVRAALAEDVGAGDVTAEFFVPEGARGRGRIFAKQRCVVAGMELARAVFAEVSGELVVSPVVADGAALEPGGTLLRVEGPVRGILTGERVALNFLQRLSGVATLTREYVEAVAGTGARILDTRKTTPGLRRLEKGAVRAGGGTNHRMGLYDMAMVKDNHLLAESRGEALQAAIRELRARRPGVRVELEADTLEQVELFLGLEGVDVILLDNMEPERLRVAVGLRNGRNPGVLLEASGGVNLRTVRGIAETGVDFVSVGALTHSAPAVDLSLEMVG